jgi:hypothetical protein
MDFRAQRAEIIASDRTRNSQHFEKWAILIASRHAFRYHRPMRLRRILQLSCVTGAAVAPVVADEASDTQAKAIEVLRATPTGVAPAIPGTPSTSDSTSAYSAARDQRVEQLKGEAELRNAGRDQRQADRKASAEAAAAQRQVSLRQAAWEVSVAQRAAMIREKTTARQNALNAQILAEVTQTKTAPNGTASAPETNLAATPAPAATVETPAKAADPVAAPADAPKLSDAELQQKAVEVLRGTAAEPTTTSLSTTTIAPAPAKTAEETAIEQRAKEILKAQQSVSEAPVAKPEPKPAPAPGDNSCIDSERTARDGCRVASEGNPGFARGDFWNRRTTGDRSRTASESDCRSEFARCVGDGFAEEARRSRQGNFTRTSGPN